MSTTNNGSADATVADNADQEIAIVNMPADDDEHDEAKSRRKTVLNKRASILNFSRRQSKSMVGISFEDQVAAIDPSAPASERLSRLLRLAVAAAAKEVSVLAEEDSNVDLADAIADATCALGRDCFEDYDVAAGAQLISECKPGSGSALSSFMPPQVKALKDYTDRVQAESETWKNMKEARKEEYKSARADKIATMKGEKWIEMDLGQLPEEEQQVLERMSDGTEAWQTVMDQERRLHQRKQQLEVKAKEGKAKLRKLEEETAGLAQKVFQTFDGQLPEGADAGKLLQATAGNGEGSEIVEEVKKWKREVFANNKAS